MKTTAFVLALASTAAASSPCTGSAVITAVTPLIAQATTCSTDSGFDLVALISGTTPTDAQKQKFLTAESCKTLYASVQKSLAGITPACTIGDIDTSGWSTVSMDKGLDALIKSLPSLLASSGATNSTSNSTANSTISSTTVSPSSTTAAPAKSGVAATGVTIAAVALTTAILHLNANKQQEIHEHLRLTIKESDVETLGEVMSMSLIPAAEAHQFI
uniref:Secreted protein n=1 Tax=Thraustotheca clavata TaxID=74557 RepID=A0A0A7CMU2_9STRA|nr:secreted protein [Thraustotheca clavata]